jgi:putative membrane protein
MSEREPAPKTTKAIDLDVLRLKDSADRTLMTWTNMTVSMIGFGFAIYEILRDKRVEGAVIPGANTPRNVGMYLVVTGTVGIVMGSVSYVRTLRRLRARHGFSFAQPALITALMMCGLGLCLCVATVTRIF